MITFKPLTPCVTRIWLLLLASGMAGCTQSDSRGAPRAADLVARTAGRYFGITHTEDGNVAEFLRLEADGSGAIYDGVGWAEICQWKADSGGRVSFRSAPHFGIIFSFDGSVINETIRGRMDLLEDGTKPRWNKVVTFQRLDSADKTPQLVGGSGGLYSDVRYIEEAGDLVGTKVFIGSVRDSLKIAVQFFEGSPGQVQTPEKLSLTSDTVWFRFGEPGHDGMDYAVVLTPGAVELSSPDFRRGTDAGSNKLPRTQSIAGFYQGKTRGTCADSAAAPNSSRDTSVSSTLSKMPAAYRDSAGLFDPDGYFSPLEEEGLSIDGRKLNWINFHTLDVVYDGGYHYDRPKVMQPPEVLISLSDPRTEKNSTYSCTAAAISADSLSLRCDAAAAGEVTINGHFDKNGWAVENVEGDYPNRSLVARVVVNKGGRIVVDAVHHFAFTIGD
jgi:hypothetical protein